MRRIYSRRFDQRIENSQADKLQEDPISARNDLVAKEKKRTLTIPCGILEEPSRTLCTGSPITRTCPAGQARTLPISTTLPIHAITARRRICHRWYQAPPTPCNTIIAFRAPRRARLTCRPEKPT